MKILVTGGAGFIGSNFINNILNDTDHYIVNIDKLTYAGSLDSIKEGKNYEFHKIDICNNERIKDVIDNCKPSLIINFAAESHVDNSIDNPLEFINTNILGVGNLLYNSFNYYKNLSNDNRDKFKFIHISTDEVFGSLDANDDKFSENSKYFPSSPYAASKASSDHLVLSWYTTYGLPVIITNCSNNYGPYQFPEKLIPRMIINCIKENKLPIYGNGKNIRDWIFVKDHCDAIMNISLNGKIGETYNIGASCEKTNNDIVNQICLIMDKKNPRSNKASYLDLIDYVDDRLGHDFRYALNTDKIERDIGWKAKMNFEKNLELTVQWYLDNKLWWNKKIRKLK